MTSRRARSNRNPTRPMSPADTGRVDPTLARAVWLRPGLVLVPGSWRLPDARWFLVPADHLPTDTAELLRHRPDADRLTSDCLSEWRPVATPAWVAGQFPHLAGHRALACPEVRDEDAAAWLRRPLLLVAVTGDRVVAATALQVAPVLDVLYAGRAQQRRFGPVFHDDGIELSVWTPTAQCVRVHLWPDAAADGPASEVRDLHRTDDGSHTITLEPRWRNAGYLFEVRVPRPGSAEVETSLVTDPWSTGLTVGSTRSVLTDLADPRWTPPGFATSSGPRLEQLVDAVVYELHVRDFSWSDPEVPEEHRGSYLAFTDEGRGTRHLRALADAGLNTVHLLPCFDVASIVEDRAHQQHPVGLEHTAPDSAEAQAIIARTAAQDGYNWGYDPFHWGVPEGSYTSLTPAADGTRPSNRDTATGGPRILEFRRMVQAIHDMGLRVVLDQVFTHTAGAGLASTSVLDRLVPGYWHRLDLDGRICNSTCMNNVATENRMAERLMVDMVVRWARDHRVDGFRFDLMGHSSAANMLAVRRALDALTPEADGVDGSQVYLYGEGWNFGEVAGNARFVQATQGQVHEARIATFTDRLRDAVRGGHPGDDPTTQGFGTGLAEHPGAALDHATDLLQLGLAGNLRDYAFRSASGTPVTGRTLPYGGTGAGYCDQPWDAISYVDAHDNETLWDALTMKLPRLPMADRVRMNTVALACSTLAQTPVLWHAGSDLLRSKSLDRNSYDSGDWFNRFDPSGTDNGFGRGLPPAPDNQAHWALMGPLLADPRLRPDADHVRLAAACAADLLRLRSATRLLRLGDAALIRQKVGFPVSGTRDQLPGVVAMHVDDEAGEPVDVQRAGVLVLFNATGRTAHQHLPGLRGRTLRLSEVQRRGADPVVRDSTWDAGRGVLHVPARTVAVFDVLA